MLAHRPIGAGNGALDVAENSIDIAKTRQFLGVVVGLGDDHRRVRAAGRRDAPEAGQAVGA